MSNRFIKSVSAVDKSAEREGIEVEYFLPTREVFRLRILRDGSSNPNYVKVSEEVLRKYRRSGVDIAKLPAEEIRKLNAEIYSRSVVIGWNEEDFGQPFSIENLKATFEADPDFVDFIVKEAGNASLFHKVTTEDSAKN